MKEVIKNSGLKIDEIYAVELIGGATRVPKLQVCISFLQFYILPFSVHRSSTDFSLN